MRVTLDGIFATISRQHHNPQRLLVLPRLAGMSACRIGLARYGAIP